MPGIHAKNSKPPIPLNKANSDSFLSVQALPATTMSLGNKEILEKFFPNLTTIPSKVLSLTRVFEPAPKTTNFCGLVFSKKKITSSVLFGLKNISAAPPKLNQL